MCIDGMCYPLFDTVASPEFIVGGDVMWIGKLRTPVTFPCEHDERDLVVVVEALKVSLDITVSRDSTDSNFATVQLYRCLLMSGVEDDVAIAFAKRVALSVELCVTLPECAAPVEPMSARAVPYAVRESSRRFRVTPLQSVCTFPVLTVSVTRANSANMFACLRGTPFYNALCRMNWITEGPIDVAAAAAVASGSDAAVAEMPAAAIDDVLTANGLARKPVQGDGNCLFRCVSAALFMLWGEGG